MGSCCCCFNHNSFDLDNIDGINIGNLKNICLRFPDALSRTKYNKYDNDHFQGLYDLELPILYITATHGCLKDDTCTKENLLEEIKNYCDDEIKVDNFDDLFFRIIVHKCSEIHLNDMEDKTRGKHFAFVWPAKNTDPTTWGNLKEKLSEYKKYICGDLNSKCVYVSGNFDKLRKKLEEGQLYPQFALHKFESLNNHIDKRDGRIDAHSIGSNYELLTDQKVQSFAFIWNTKSYTESRFYAEKEIDTETTEPEQEITGILSSINLIRGLLILIQCLLLPIFSLFPPTFCTCKKKHSTDSKYLADKLPLDISKLFTENAFCQNHQCFKKLASFILSVLIYSIVVAGCALYLHDARPSSDGNCAHLLFFDCWGPLIFYLIATITIIAWCGQQKKYSPPKQHRLLYHQMTQQSEKIITYVYAQQKGFFDLCEPKRGLISLKPFKLKSCKMSRVFWILLCTLPIFVVQNWETFQCKTLPLFNVYYVLSNLFSFICVFEFMLLWESMFVRLELYRDNVISLLKLITESEKTKKNDNKNDEVKISLLNTNNLLSWKELQNFLRQKGMILFASLEAPLLSLWMLTACSFGGGLFCIFKVLLNDATQNKLLFSDSALMTWIYLTILTVSQSARMLFWYGEQFSMATKNIDNAIKNQSIMLKYKNITLQKIEYENTQKKHLMTEVVKLSENISHDGVIPRAFGFIQFNQLTGVAVKSIVFAALPSFYQILQIMLGGITQLNDENVSNHSQPSVNVTNIE